jgi:hypothetical protein
MVIPAFFELSIRATELSNTFDALIIISSTWEPDYASRPQVVYFDVWPWVLIVCRRRSYDCVSASPVVDPCGRHQAQPLEGEGTSKTNRERTISKRIIQNYDTN